MKRPVSPLTSKRVAPAAPRSPETPLNSGGESDDRFEEYFRELPGFVRQARIQVADAPNTLRHLADALDGTINEFSMDAGGQTLEAASVQIRASVASAAAILVELAVFAGHLAELSRGADVLRP